MNKQVRMMGAEFTRSIGNPWFSISLGIGCSLMLANFITLVIPISQNLGSILGAFPDSLYNRWAGAWGFDIFTQVYYFIIPLLAVLPFGWSLKYDIDTGYYQNLVARVGRKSYFKAKIVAVFFSGAIAVTLPLVMNFLLSACVLPAIQPDVSAIGAFSVGRMDMWSDVYYTDALIYVILFFILTSVTGGVVACFALPISVLASNQLFATLSPFFILAIVNTVTFDTPFASISPSNFLRISQPTACDSLQVVFFFVMMVLIVGLTYWGFCRKSYVWR